MLNTFSLLRVVRTSARGLEIGLEAEDNLDMPP